MRVDNPAGRLDRFWGRVDRNHNELIGAWVRGPRVLDLGCGYGSFTGYANDNLEVDCVGVDLSEDDLAIARRRYAGSEFVRANAERLPLDAGSCDTVVLRDALHHLVNEADWHKVAAEIRRVSTPNARIVFFDPNVQPLLRLARRVSRHEDEETTFEQATTIMDQLGYRRMHVAFDTLFSLPLSGGYVGVELVPDWPRLHCFLLAAEEKAESLVNRLGLGRQLAWRYLIAGERTS